ncbi:PGF-CTERM sorting domain-containing protein [Haladaptatus sp. R4]|uniref:PGF-CTERM sorting domain-containing protein n=1 Tax=Haladaptatus sp. R4 TaxID=1679489 RepID=UPI0007B4EDD5|nr:PGF-CTERM sorting domain-containing protein [Haladaptatus sp. R4]KZN25435.1 PGF-CTERM sorting domain-containing protein [Haladaptatus sp. R4]
MVRNVSAHTLLAPLLVLMVLIAPVAAISPVTAPQAAQRQTLTTDEPADSVYVMDNGDAVLAYNDTNTDSTDNSSLEFGANVTKGLVHVLATDETESDMDAAMSLVMTPDGYTGNGSLTADGPDSLSNLDLDVSSVQNEQQANADVALDAAFDSGSSMSTAGSVHTDGSATVTGDSFRTNGTGSMTATASALDEHLKYDLRETNDGFVLKASRKGELSSYTSSNWNSEEKAKERLEAQYALVSQQTSAEVTIDEYQFDTSGDEPKLDIQYHVTFVGVKDALSQSIVSSLESSSSVSITDEQADSLTADIEKMRIDHITLAMDRQGGKTTVDWNVEIDDYDAAMVDALEVMENTDSSSISQDSIDRMKTQFAAQNAADLEQTVTWTADVTHPSGETTSVSAEVHYRTKHWGAYTREMNDRGVELGTSSVEFHAESDGDEVTAHGSVELERKAMLSKITDSMLSSLDSTAGSSAGSSNGMELVRAFKRSEFRTARVDMNVESGTVTVEGGAQFDNMSAFANVLGDSYGGANVADVVGRTNGNTTTTYVRVKGLVGENATKADVRALAIANDDTEIYMPGEWNRSFPSMDTKDAATYLGLQQDAKESKNESGQPGFGIGVAVVALAAVALLSRRD